MYKLVPDRLMKGWIAEKLAYISHIIVHIWNSLPDSAVSAASVNMTWYMPTEPIHLLPEVNM